MLNMDLVYRDYAQYVFKFLMTLCMEEHTAEELTQETFYQAVRGANKYDGSCKISTWLCQICQAPLDTRSLTGADARGTEPLSEVEEAAMAADTATPEQRVSTKTKRWSCSERSTCCRKRRKKWCY